MTPKQNQMEPTTADYTPRDTQTLMKLSEAQRRKIERLQRENGRLSARVDQLEQLRAEAAELIRSQAADIERYKAKVKRLSLVDYW